MVMRPLLLVVVAVLKVILLQAQQISSPDPVIYRVFYAHEHVRDTSNGSVYEEDMVLLIGEKSSLFASFEKIRLRVNRTEYIRDQTNSGNFRVNLEPGRIVIPQEFIIWYGRNNVVVHDCLERLFTYEDEFEPIYWTILSEEREIEGLKCYKATAHYKGREWEVWFTPEINYPAGPWKLRGLPGLILEAQDRRGHVSYRFTHMESANVDNDIFAKQPDYNYVQLHSINTLNQVSKKEFGQLWEDAQKDPRAFRLRQMSVQSDLGFNTFSDYGILNPNSWARKIPNPIELDE